LDFDAPHLYFDFYKKTFSTQKGGSFYRTSSIIYRWFL